MSKVCSGVSVVLLLHFTLPSGSWSVEGEKKQNKDEEGQAEIQETKHVINT